MDANKEIITDLQMCRFLSLTTFAGLAWFSLFLFLHFPVQLVQSAVQWTIRRRSSSEMASVAERVQLPFLQNSPNRELNDRAIPQKRKQLDRAERPASCEMSRKEPIPQSRGPDPDRIQGRSSRISIWISALGRSDLRFQCRRPMDVDPT